MPSSGQAKDRSASDLLRLLLKTLPWTEEESSCSSATHCSTYTPLQTLSPRTWNTATWCGSLSCSVRIAFMSFSTALLL